MKAGPALIAPPRLETPRLILDAHTQADLDPLAALWADPAVIGHLWGVPSTPEESWMRLLRYRGLWPVLGYGYWALRDKATGRFVGDLGFADFHRVVRPPIAGVPEAGWVLAAALHRQGLAHEALTAALAWLDVQPCGDRSVCLIGPANVRSIRLALRHGYGDVVETELQGEAALLLTRPRGASIAA